MYAELLDHHLPMKVYGIEDEGYIHLLIFTSRRYIQVADPALERDETGILNSITFDK